MLKNNKGFTLVELLAIVVILAIIMVLAAPSMTKQIAKKEDTDQTILDEKISNAAKIYAAKYYSEKIVDCTTIGNCDINFTLNDLEQDGLINLKDKCSNAMDKNISIVREAGGIKYDYKYINNKGGEALDDVIINDCASEKIGNN